MKAFVKNNVVIAISSAIPVGWSDLIEIDLGGRTDLPVVGWSYDVDADKFFMLDVSIPEYSLEDLKQAAIKTVNDAVSAIRLSYIGLMSNQFGIYTAKYQDAKAFKMKVFGENVADYLWLASECSATGATPTEVADDFIRRYSEMVTAFGKAEELRRYSKIQIGETLTIPELRAVKTEALKEVRALMFKE